MPEADEYGSMEVWKRNRGIPSCNEYRSDLMGEEIALKDPLKPVDRTGWFPGKIVEMENSVKERIIQRIL